MTTGSPSRQRRRFDPLPLVVIGVLVAVLAAIGCLAGSLVVIDRERREPTPPPVTTPSPKPTPSQSVPGSGPSGGGSGGPLSGALLH